ncbi:hypothetical protein [Desulfohalovibrio reitneri]|uniref:hypothetical protein n=1 Tax=Desulfohalovibrio reitneri TaxID=1307759 RepID=UPI0004A6F4A9|nr:hypothetical protein [Desulfohalovibrio reitneri]
MRRIIVTLLLFGLTACSGFGAGSGNSPDMPAFRETTSGVIASQRVIKTDPTSSEPVQTFDGARAAETMKTYREGGKKSDGGAGDEFQSVFQDMLGGK